MDLSPLYFCTPASWRPPSSDCELYNVSSPEATSPPPCADFSPDLSPFPGSTAPRSAPPWEAKSLSSRAVSGSPGETSRRRRWRNPTEQRQSASEKEKLRMRDLTAALHHLRTYLPPSVAPAGQTLTKIETLRLAIRYISHLSSQLGLPEEPLGRRKEAGTPEASCYSSGGENWRGAACPEPPHHALAHHTLAHHALRTADTRTAGTGMELPACDQFLASTLHPLLECPLYPDMTLPYQDYSTSVHYENASAEFWV